MRSHEDGPARKRAGLAVAVIVAGLVNFGCSGETGEAEEAVGSVGSTLGSTEPVQWITNGYQLRYMSLTGNYALANDINLRTRYGWNPIGTPGNPFRGTLDGMGHVINNLTISNAGGSSTGMFGATREAIIRNVGLTNVSVTGGNTTGALVGVVFDSEITSTYVTGTVTASSSNTFASAGMAVGSMYGASVLSRSYATGTVNGNAAYIGGMVGLLSSCSNPSSLATVQEVFTNVAVSPTTSEGTYSILAGGAVGLANGGFLTDVSTVGTTTGRDYAGGVVGAFMNLDYCLGGFDDLLSRGIVTVSNMQDRTGPIGYVGGGSLIRCGAAFWDTDTDGGIAPTLPNCEPTGYSDSTLRAPHPAPNLLLWPFIHGALQSDGTGSDGEWGFGIETEPQVWSLNSSSQHITLTRIPNPGVQPL